MALGLQAGSDNGEIKPFIKYDARAGRVSRVDRFQGSSGQYESKEEDITNGCTFIADLANVRVGWVNFTDQGPIQRMVILGKEPIPARPTDLKSDGKLAFKQGFEIDVLLAKASGGGPARKFGSSAGCVIRAIDELHDAYCAAAEAAQGKLPIVQLTGTHVVKSGLSNNYRPTFAIAGWVDRPAELNGAPQPAAQPRQAATPPSTGSTQVPPPAARQPAPQPAFNANDFG